MKYLKLVFCLIACDIFTLIHSAQNKTFVPKKHWQTIEEGQEIPAGLHIRVNLQTGKKEAKLLDKKNNTENSTTIEENKQQIKSLLPLLDDDDGAYHQKSVQENKTKHNITTINSTLEEALKNISKSDSHLLTAVDHDGNDVRGEHIRAKFKSYEEIKKAFAESNMDIKSDFEIINNLFEQYENLSKSNERDLILNRILDDLNYLSHQIDNALWFIDKGGLNSIILPVLVNQTNKDLRIKSLRILGALTQNNPKVKIHVFEQNFGTYLTQILLNSTDLDELSAGLYAFGSLLRNFPHAQKQIMPKTGIKALMNCLQKEINYKIKIKVLTLINDLLLEREDVLNHEPSDSIKYQQYEFVLMDYWLKENGYCELIGDFLNTIQIDLLNNIELLDDIVNALEKSHKFCKDIWSKLNTMKMILYDVEENFKNENSNNNNDGDDDEYLLEIVKRLHNLNRIIYENKKIKNDEL